MKEYCEKHVRSKDNEGRTSKRLFQNRHDGLELRRILSEQLIDAPYALQLVIRRRRSAKQMLGGWKQNAFGIEGRFQGLMHSSERQPTKFEPYIVFVALEAVEF